MSVPAESMTLGAMQRPMQQPAQPLTLGSLPAPDLGQQLWKNTLQQYPILGKQNIGFIYKPDIPNAGNGGLESYVPGETQRPKNLPLDQFGIGVYADNLEPRHILADWVSHRGIETDPTVKKHYEDFQQSLTEKQKGVLRDQYNWATKQKKNPEKRSYQEWEKVSGIPSYFRGYTFNQWPDRFNEKVYTQAQRKSLDNLRNYLGYKAQPYAGTEK